MPAFLETDVLLDQPGTVGEEGEGGREGGRVGGSLVVKTGADRLREELKAREEEEEERKREGRWR